MKSVVASAWLFTSTAPRTAWPHHYAAANCPSSLKVERAAGIDLAHRLLRRETITGLV